ncbi:MAG: hypothetical protein ACYCR4_14290 [Acidimicrobiales bacterium]
MRRQERQVWLGWCVSTSFVDCSDNGELACRICGKPNYGSGISAQRIRVAIGHGEALETARNGASDVVAALRRLHSALAAG